MIRKIIVGAAIIGVPLAVWYASQFGQPDVVLFKQAITKSSSSSESEQTPKVLIDVQISALESDHEFVCTDASGDQFRIDYTGSAPSTAFASGQRHRFLGHVHDGTAPYFHATQRFDQ